MSKYLLEEDEVRRLADRLERLESVWPSLKHDSKIPIAASSYPFRFKLLESMAGGSANAAIFFFGGTTADIHDTDSVLDDSSQYSTATSGMKGVCLATTDYHVLSIDGYGSTSVAGSTAVEYMGLATTTYATTDGTITIDNLEPMQGTGTTLTTLDAFNKFAWPITNNGSCYIKHNEHSSRYDLIQTWCQVTGGSSTPSMPAT